MADDASTRVDDLSTGIQPELNHLESFSSTSGLAVVASIPATHPPDEDLWPRAMERFRQRADEEIIGYVAEFHSMDELLDACSDSKDRVRRMILPRVILATMPYLRYLRSFYGVVDTMIQSNPDISALVWGPIKFFIDVFVRTADVPTKILDTFEALGTDLPRYKRYASIFRNSAGLQNASLELYTEIILFCSQLIKHFNREPYVTIIRGFHYCQVFEDELAETLDSLRARMILVGKEIDIAEKEQRQFHFTDLQKRFDHISILPKLRLPCHIIPFRMNKRFFGRQTELRRMAASIITSEKVQKVVVVQGLGGVGKTELALKFIYNHLDDFSAIFWMSADGEGKIAQSYYEVFRALGFEHTSDQKKAFEDVTRWLSSTEIQWLMVFDNACDETFTDLESYWPPGMNGTIVITTRNSATSHHFAVLETIQLEPFEIAESALFLQSMIANCPYIMPRDPGQEIRRIAAMLGGLPLAMSQISGLLIESKCPLDEFVSMYSTHENIKTINTTSTAGSTTFYSYTLSTVWAMTIASLDPQAATMLDLIVFLDPDNIPSCIFQTLPKESLPKCLEFLTNKLTFQLTTQRLLSHCLVKANDDKGTLSIHRLVQFSVLQRMTTERRKEAFDHTLHILSQLFPLHLPYRLEMASIWPLSEILIQHVLSLCSCYKDFSAVLGVPIELANLLDSCSWYLFERGLYKTALIVFDVAKDICIRHPEDQSITLANLYSTFGTIYRNSNDPVKAQELFDLAIENREHAILTGLPRASDIRRADSYMHMGSVLLSLNNIPKSLEYHLRAIEIREQTPENEPQILALSYINIGWAYWQNQQLDDASEVLERSLQIMERLQMSGSGQSGQPSWAMKALGNVRIDQGRWEEALELHQKAFTMQLHIWGKSHHETGDLCHKMGIHAHHSNDAEGAVSWFEKALEVYRSTDMEVDAAVCRTMYRLSKVLIENGRTDEGIMMRREAGRMRLQINGVPADEDDDLEYYECLVPYWGR
ncbi:hypothetical protein DL98DRAFT_518934 [Cadophora sp. DSE1049]|nr:hypothetical protein DL98DRAFT_518934 [Cadophora sp. DSE1049]